MYGSVPVAFGTAAAVGAATATPTTTAALWTTALALGRWGWAHECIVDMNGLFEELGTVEVLDGVAGFRQG